MSIDGIKLERSDDHDATKLSEPVVFSDMLEVLRCTRDSVRVN